LRNVKGMVIIMIYKVIIFDLGDTLIRQFPDQIHIFIRIFKKLGLKLTIADEDSIRLAVQNAAYEQIALEEDGIQRMNDYDFDMMLFRAALSCVCQHYDETFVYKCIELQSKEYNQEKIVDGDTLIAFNYCCLYRLKRIS